MFTTSTPRMSPSQIARLVNDKDKMQNLVCRVSEYLADTLQLVDDDVQRNMPFVEVSRQEIRHFPTQQRQEEMEQLAKTYDFVVLAEDHAERMRDCAMACLGQNVNITPFTAEKPYYCDDAIIREEAGVVTSTIDVGGMGDRLQTDVAELAVQWLDSLDTVLSGAAGIKRSHEGDKALVELKRELALAIAERIAIMSRRSVLDDRLSTRALDYLIEAEFMRSVPYAEAMARSDASAMRMLRVLASAPTGEQARSLLKDRLGNISYVVRKPPCELHSFRAQLKLDQLARALAPDLDLEVRVALTAFWSDNHGSDMLYNIDRAIASVEQWMPPKPSAFRSVIKDCGKASADLAIPVMPFLHSPRCFASRGTQETRTGLDEQGERAVRMIRCVMEMAGRGLFTSGVVSAEALDPVATDAWISGRMAGNMINNTLAIGSKGFKMADFIARMYDPGGVHRKDLDNAVCALSRFSCDELETVFSSNGPILEAVCYELSRRTWSLLTSSTKNLLILNKDGRSDYSFDRCEYRAFAVDALAGVLPIVALHRTRLGIPSFTRQHSMADVLRTIPKAADWSPLKGTLRLGLEDIQSGHPSARAVFDALHDRSFLVKRTGDRKHRKKVQYEFDTVQLSIMFGRFMNIST